MTVIAIIEHGYHPKKEETPLNAGTWARLACTVMAAIGRGYDYQYTAEQGEAFNKARAESFDPEPLTPDCPIYFHQLAVMVGTISHHVKLPSATNDANRSTDTVMAMPPSSSGSTPRGRDRIMTRSRMASLAQDIPANTPARSASASIHSRFVSARDRLGPPQDRSSSPKRRRNLTPSTSSLFRKRIPVATAEMKVDPQAIPTQSPRSVIDLTVTKPTPPPALSPARDTRL